MVDQSINCTTEGVKYYDSLYSVQIHHPINSGIMKIDCVKKFVKQVLQRKTIVSINSSTLKKHDLKQIVLFKNEKIIINR